MNEQLHPIVTYIRTRAFNPTQLDNICQNNPEE